MVDQIWERYGRAAIDLFTSLVNTKSLLYRQTLSLKDEAPLGVDVLAHPLPDVLFYAFPPLSLTSPTRVRENGLSLLLIALVGRGVCVWQKLFSSFRENPGHSHCAGTCCHKWAGRYFTPTRSESIFGPGPLRAKFEF